MARRHPDLPASPKVRLSRAEVFAGLERVDGDAGARSRVLGMEVRFRQRVDAYIAAKTRKGEPKTNPFVLMMHSRRMGYRQVAEVVKDVSAGASFASMETEAGKMVERVTFEAFGWTIVESAMHSDDTVLDAWKVEGGTLRCATLKSGPRCLNDAMSKDIGSDVARNVIGWAAKNGAQAVDFSYAVIYGTPLRSNKKDWHVLRNIAEAMPLGSEVSTSHKKAWALGYTHEGLRISAAVRIGLDWWSYLGGPDTWIEVSAAFIRACIQPTADNAGTSGHVPTDFNVALLQRSQLEWLVLAAGHYCDQLID